ncbi:MAG: TetR/AcrR family transcriptional regulator [Candidatus Rokuibacteriota bacterium]
MTKGSVSGKRGSRSSPQAARTELRRTEIFRSLGLVLQERGIGGITMGEIAERLGMTKGSLYYYFEDKDDLLYQCHMRAMEVSLRALAEPAEGMSPDARLRRVLVTHTRGITEEVYGAVVLTDIESLSPARRRRYVAKRDRFERGVREIIAQGVRDKVFREVDPKLAGFVMLGAINWISKWYSPDGLWSSPEVAEQFADFLLAALRP